jgi:hypothetical protein
LCGGIERRKRDLNRHESGKSLVTIGAKKNAIVCSLVQFEPK